MPEVKTKDKTLPSRYPEVYRAGDFILCRATENRGKLGATTFLGKLIQAGERSRFGDSDYARWTHAALIINAKGDLIEAIESGVKQTNIAKYAGTDYVIVGSDLEQQQRLLVVHDAIKRVGSEYGILNFVALGLKVLVGRQLAIHWDGQYICSGLVALLTEPGRYDRSPEMMMPADLAEYYQVHSGEPAPALGWFGRVLNLLRLLFDTITVHRGDPAPKA